MYDPNVKSPKSCGQQKQSHKDMYKTSPNWQLIYKKECLTQLNDRRKESRSRLIERFRNIDLNETSVVEELVTTEKTQIVEQVMQSVWSQYTSQLPIDSTDITDFMEQIRQELLIEESQYWEEMLEWRKEEEVQWMVQNRDSVVCFFCQKNPLDITTSNDNKSELVCSKCGFNLRTPFSLTLPYLQERVDHIIAQHSVLCGNTSLKFNLINDCSNNGYNNISVSCDWSRGYGERGDSSAQQQHWQTVWYCMGEQCAEHTLTAHVKLRSF
ncbi:unnamed protein product [Oppiella nova]|uniref:RPA-interacting protein C-terminal domain-containing protein n=1 Tax=Oppiella nova TaxID=334625 RepID=A0A7R9QNK3_9ACAR|nr:unnamed protein product [Oppiella nova]CAG2169665.1 unnamed protein product [Oppiella nova]